MAENLWALREQKKISVAMLANRAGLPIGLIMEYESGLRSIDPRHLGRIARALYVEESSIKLRSDPRPGAAPLERQPARGAPRVPAPAAPPIAPRSAAARPQERPARQRFTPRAPLPPRPSQVSHLENVLKRLKKTQAELEAELGKPISALDRSAFSTLLKELQARFKDVPLPVRRRAYLPEAVDEFEARYLTAAQADRRRLHFSLFDGSSVDGSIIGFGPYSITVETGDGAAVTLNKLAIVSYSTATGRQAQEPSQ